MATAFTMYAGDSKTIEVNVIDPTGAAVDITGASVRWQIARTVKDPLPLVEKSTANGITIVNGPAGRFNVLLQPLDTVALNGSYYFEAEVNAAGALSTVLTGTMQVNPALIDP